MITEATTRGTLRQTGSAALLVCAGWLAVLSMPAAAQEGARFTMERTDDGYVRLDTRTGQMSLCRTRGEQIVCQMAADDRAAFEADIAALASRVDALEADGRAPRPDLPSDAEIDRTMGIMETFMRRFFALVDEFQGNEPAQPETGTPDVPDRT
jgi:hypothetical protein